MERKQKRKSKSGHVLGSKAKQRKLQAEAESTSAEEVQAVSCHQVPETAQLVEEEVDSGAGKVAGEDNEKRVGLEENAVITDPIVSHFEQELSEDGVETLSQLFENPQSYSHHKDSVLGGVGMVDCLPGKSCSLDVEGKSFKDIFVKKTLSELWQPKDGARLTPLQTKLYEIMGSYKDLLFARRSFSNGEEIRKTYLLHVLNHVLKTRSKIVKNNARLKQAADNNVEMEPPRDQGLTRPKVLILVPFREAALRTVNLLIELLIPKGQGQINNRKRFMEEFREEEHLKAAIKKPESYDAMFSGNIDDCFRVGISLKKKTVNLYTEFYSSDVILASPLGLRTIIGAEGDMERDFDFLSSLEVVVVDQADVYLMQNWEHLLHLLDHTHCQPKEAHGVDFSRVRMWALDGRSAYYRQMLVFCDFLTPEINSLFGSHSKNYAGKVKVFEPTCRGTLSETGVQVSHVFRKFPCSSHSELPSARLDYFMEQMLPDYTGDLMKRTAIVVPSYLDYVQIKGRMSRLELDYVSLSEYTKSSDVSRARTKFFRGQTHFLLYTERLHFFRRYRIRGMHHLVFYSPPSYAEFYPELVEMLTEAPAGMTCSVMYSSYDVLALGRIVGSTNARQMVTSQDNLHTFYTKS